MNRGVIAKFTHEAWPLTLVFAAAVGAFETLIAGVIEVVPSDMTQQWLKLEFVQRFLEGLLGTNVAGMGVAQVFRALAWVHPVVLAIVWAHAITVCTRLPAAEIDRGTIDLLLGLPVSRWSLYAGSTLIALLSGLVVVCGALAGHFCGRTFISTEMRMDSSLLAVVIANLLCMYAAVVGASCLVSAACDRRGRAVAIVLSILLAMFALDFLAQFWSPARHCEFLSVMHYYRPLDIVRQSAWPTRDLCTLLVSGGVCWLIGGCLFSRRDLSAV